jgi:predicted Zn-dependent protease
VPISFLKFSRNAEREADMLGAQYMWAAGYDPRALNDFFKKLESKEKKKPGTLAKVFRTHPITTDREAAVADLVARFPDRDEYVVTTSEFDRVKSRLVSLTNTPDRMGAPSETGPRRPTLKRRPADSQGPSDPMDPSNDKQPADPTTAQPEPGNRPVLKRRDSDTSVPTAPQP